MSHPTPSASLAVVKRKRESRESRLKDSSNSEGKPHAGDVSSYPQACLSNEEKKIVNCDATTIVNAIQEKKYTSVQVLEAFIRVAVRAQDVTNCLTESCLAEARKRAEELDEHLKETGTVVGKLHGLPVSIKDHIKVKGLDTSTGYIAWANNTVSENDALVVKILRDAGAIIYVKTQNPQTLLSLETNNNIFGRVLNPYNIALTSGGSSGGEGALIACGGSPMGVGTDIGGSIRIPAAHCGLYGLKGSVARLPHSGLLGSHDGMDAIVGCVGPLATSARDLELFCEVMLDAEPWLSEPPLLEMPWKRDVARGLGLPEKLTIAILYDDGVVAPHPPITQALERYAEGLKAAGHEVIVWQPLDHKEGWDLIMKLYFLDGGAEYKKTLADGKEEPVPQTKWILDQIAEKDKSFSVQEIFRLNLEREAFRAKALAHWNETRGETGRPVDAILCPVAATLAPPHDTTSWWGYTSHWNLLDLPAVVFPAGQYSATQLLPQHLPSPRNSVETYIAQQWNPDVYDNAPISLQLVGRRLNEERLLAILRVIEQVVPGRNRKGGLVNGVNGHQ